MNFELLADEIRELAEDDVDGAIALSGLSDREVVQHVVTCPCCEDCPVSDEQLDELVLSAVDLNDFIHKYNASQMTYSLTDKELEAVSTILYAAIGTAATVVAGLRGIPNTPETDDAVCVIEDEIRAFVNHLTAED